jgi:hypothetical protein
MGYPSFWNLRLLDEDRSVNEMKMCLELGIFYLTLVKSRKRYESNFLLVLDFRSEFANKDFQFYFEHNLDLRFCQAFTGPIHDSTF